MNPDRIIVEQQDMYSILLVEDSGIFRGIVDKNIEQFRSSGKQVILFPEKLKSGDLISPFEAARK